MGNNEFIEDIDVVVQKLTHQVTEEELEKVQKLRNDLLEMQKRNVVKINHSVMEIIIAKYLIQNGFDVNLEYVLNGISCDIYAKKGFGSLIVEVETGFVPPDHALDPITYLKARITSKITRYSAFANKFVLASTPYYIMQIPSSLTKPPRFRTDEEIAYMKSLCDLYYSNPPVSLEEIRNSRLHSIFIVDVDNVKVTEIEVNEYIGRTALWAF
ncbi:hypothetical protein GF319_02595 [Candidatus Bathyarchaeota archaeon]|nr:hypothetical protein [Candidatus Bathyarchaeota archaeon]